MPFHGVLNVNKPKGMTSHDVVARIRRLTGQRKVGHAGTLDPMATGVLVVLLGKATRLSEYLMRGTKTYRAVVRLGVETETYDAEGKVVSMKPLPELDEAALNDVLSRFVGEIEQVPPVFSALKQGGVPMHRLARSGKDVKPEPRKVTIESLELESWDMPDMTLRVVCSSGTYIRSLAHDLGEAIGCGAHLVALTRLASGEFVLEEAHSLDEIETAAEAGALARLILPMDFGIWWMPEVIFMGRERWQLLHGQPARAAKGEPAPIARAYDAEGSFLAVVSFDDATGTWHPRKVFADA